MFYTMKQKKTGISTDDSMCKLVYIKKNYLFPTSNTFFT